MISASDRENAIMLINAAVASGARLSKACKELGITDRTYFRWKKLKRKTGSYEDRRISCAHPAPANKISSGEHQQILNAVNDPKYADMPPCEIVPALADNGTYIASESTFYRVLHEERMQNHRGRSDEPHHRGTDTGACRFSARHGAARRGEQKQGQTGREDSADFHKRFLPHGIIRRVEKIYHLFLISQPA